MAGTGQYALHDGDQMLFQSPAFTDGACTQFDHPCLGLALLLVLEWVNQFVVDIWLTLRRRSTELIFLSLCV